jgi:hypothetical protein
MGELLRIPNLWPLPSRRDARGQKSYDSIQSGPCFVVYLPAEAFTAKFDACDLENVLAGLQTSGYEYELLVGFTRLGSLFGLLDRQEVPELMRHRVWVGR